MPPSTDNSLSVVVTQDHLNRLWRVTWYVISPDGRLVLDGAKEYSTDLTDASELETAVLALYSDLLTLL